MVSQLYVDGITDTVPHKFASSLTAGHIADMNVCTGGKRGLLVIRR